MNAVSDITKKGQLENVGDVMSQEEFQDDNQSSGKHKKKKDKHSSKKKKSPSGESSSTLETESTSVKSPTPIPTPPPDGKPKELTAPPASFSSSRTAKPTPPVPLVPPPEAPSKNDLHNLLDIDPFSKSHSNYNEDTIADVIFLDPSSCSRKYKFECFGGEIYPFSMLCALGASHRLLKLCFDAFPQAGKEKDIWIGTPLHYACAYLGSIENVKWLMEISPGSAASMNRLRRTPFHAICLFNPRPEILQVLIDLAPMGLQSADKDGNTALHVRTKKLFGECTRAE